MEFSKWAEATYRLVVTGVLLMGIPDIALAQNQNKIEFSVGDSCAVLAYGSSDAFLWLVESLDLIELQEFCFPEEPYVCSDYSAYIKGVGRIEIGGEGETGMCRLERF